MSVIEDVNNYRDQDSKQPDLRETLFPYLRRWKWFIISVILFLSLGYLNVKLSTPLYKIETDLLIKDNKKEAGGSNDLLKDLNLFSSDKIIDNEIQILKSKTILESVINVLKLQTSYINIDGIRKREEYGNLPFAIELLKPYASAYKNILSVQLVNDKEVEINGKKFPTNAPIQSECGIILVQPVLTLINMF